MDWSLSKGDQAVVRAALGKDSYVNVCDYAGNTYSWSMENDDLKVAATRERDVIRLTGTVDGKKVEQIFQIDDAPWYQPLSFSLRELVLDDTVQATHFWTIRADSLEAIKMQAKVMAHERIQLGDMEVEAIKVEVRPSGVLAAFWHGNYWFRSEDALFLKYRSRHGPPGTPETNIRLLQ
jgi:hypothetical protein